MPNRHVRIALLLGTISAFCAIAAIQYLPEGFRERQTPRSSLRPASSAELSRGQTSVSSPNPPLVHHSPQSMSPLWLVLVRTEMSRTPRGSVAFIGTSALSPRAYNAGALLANKAYLMEIHEDYVVLERDGKSARLYAMGKQPAATELLDAVLLTVGGSPSSSNAIADSHDELTDVIRASPAFDGNTFHGLIVYSNPRSNVFSSLGLAPGDIITAIDGKSLADFDSAIAALRPLLEGRSLVVTVERDAQSNTFAVDGSLIASDGAIQARSN